MKQFSTTPYGQYPLFYPPVAHFFPIIFFEQNNKKSIP